MDVDQKLMQRASNGDSEAFGELIRRHQQLAWGLAYRLLRDPGEAEDVAQEAFLKILRNADSYKPSAQFNTYLTRVVTRLCYDRWDKKKPVYIEPAKQGVNPSCSPSPLDGFIAEEETKRVQKAIDELPRRQKTALYLRYYEDYGYTEIAATLETSEKGAERLLARGREQLRQKLTVNEENNSGV